MKRNKKPKKTQVRKIVKLLKESVLTRMMIEKITKIRRESVCSVIEGLRKYEDVVVVYKLPCKETGNVAEWLTMNQAIISSFKKEMGIANQLNLFAQ